MTGKATDARPSVRRIPGNERTRFFFGFAADIPRTSFEVSSGSSVYLTLK
jgi:hypothetical protein